VYDWENQTGCGFGTVIVLSVVIETLWDVRDTANKLGLETGVIYDPTYPYTVDEEIAKLIPIDVDTAPRVFKNGKVHLCRDEITCGYVFGDKNEPELNLLLDKFSLMP
jgi:hypothetical protein